MPHQCLCHQILNTLLSYRYVYEFRKKENHLILTLHDSYFLHIYTQWDNVILCSVIQQHVFVGVEGDVPRNQCMAEHHSMSIEGGGISWHIADGKWKMWEMNSDHWSSGSAVASTGRSIPCNCAPCIG